MLKFIYPNKLMKRQIITLFWIPCRDIGVVYTKKREYDKKENIKPDATLSIIGSFNDRHQFFHPNQICNGFGLRYGMINKVYGKGGKMLVEFDNKVCASRYTTGMSIMSTIVNYRNKIGTNIMVPNIPLIDSVASRLFLWFRSCFAINNIDRYFLYLASVTLLLGVVNHWSSWSIALYYIFCYQRCLL